MSRKSEFSQVLHPYLGKRHALKSKMAKSLGNYLGKGGATGKGCVILPSFFRRDVEFQAEHAA